MADDEKMPDKSNRRHDKPSPKEGGNDDEARLKETLMKKKITQKKNRRATSTSTAVVDGNGGVVVEGGGVPLPSSRGGGNENGGTEGNDNVATAAAASLSSSKRDEKATDSREDGGKRGEFVASASSASAANGERKTRGGAIDDGGGGGISGRNNNSNHHRGRKRRRRRDRRKDRGGGRGGGGGGVRDGPSPRDRDYRRGVGGGGPPSHPPPPGEYRGGDIYGRGGPPLPPHPRDFYGDRRGGGGGWGDDRRGGGGGGWRDERDRDHHHHGGGGGGGGGWRDRDDYWDGPPARGRPPVRRGDRIGNPPRGGGVGGGGGGGMTSIGHNKDRSHSLSSRSYSHSPSRSRSYSSSRSRSRSPRSGSGRSYSRSPSRSRSYSRSGSRSYSRSPSRDPDAVKRKRSESGGGSAGGGSRGGRSRSHDSSPSPHQHPPPDESTKDQRTVFVSQLVMRADERDIGRYFHRRVGTRVRDVILLRDKRTGRHKGCAYVELGALEDVDRALGESGKTPDFQRFPILVKPTESEKNVGAVGVGASSVTYAAGGSAANAAPYPTTADGKRIESQKVYVGSIDRCVTQAQLYALFSQFGPLDKVLLQMDMTTGMSRGFAFLSFRDPKDANLAIQTMSGQMLAGRPLKTGWANQQASAAGVVEVKSDQFPDDMNEKIGKVNAAMNQLTGSSLTTMIGRVDPSAQQALLAAGPAGALGIMPSAQLASVADAALDMALGVAPAPAAAGNAVPLAVATQAIPTSAPPSVDAKVIGRVDNPSPHILVQNMFDKDEEDSPGWENDIKLDFEEECAQYGTITNVMVMSKDPGGKIYASFNSVDGAMSCAKNLAGRWFDKRQLRVEFVDSIPSSS